MRLRGDHLVLPALLLLASCAPGTDRSGSIGGSSVANSDTSSTVTANPAVDAELSRETDATSRAELATPAVTTTIESGAATRGDSTEPDEDSLTEAADSWYVYAQAGATAVAEQINADGIRGLAQDDLEAILVEASDAAYELEYPSVVLYLDVSVSVDPPTVTVTVGDEEDDARSSAYVCLSAEQAIVMKDPCPGTD